MSKRIDLTGKRYGRLTALEYVGVNKFKKALWRCLCDCGNTYVANGNSLVTHLTKSCGCLKREYQAAMGKIHIEGMT